MLFNNSPCFVGTFILLTLVSGCSSQILSKSPQKSLISPAQATMVHLNQAKTCLNQTNDCSQLPATATKSQQHLDATFQQLVSQLGGASREKLINSQLAWENFVEAKCRFDLRGNISNLSSSVSSRCLDTLIQQRTQDLKQHLTLSQSINSTKPD